MMDANVLSNLLAYAAQIACVTVAGSLLPRILRVDAAVVRYAYWRGLLALCLVLPWIQGRQHAASAPNGVATRVLAPSVAAVSKAAAVAAPGASIQWLPIVGAILIGGLVLRLAWLGAGLLRLRRVAAAGAVAPPCGDEHDLQRAIGTRAEIRYVVDLAQPLTFGVVKPLVLLPETLREHSPAIQRAVLCHELLHVQRRDWAWVLAEETVRAVLWFHPAVWWLISRVQLAREEVVDELSVLATGRRTYLEALMAFADQRPLAPAAAFARRRQLFRRMVLISKEGAMSAKRLLFSCAVMALVVLAGSWYAAGAFPLKESAGPQTLQTDPGPLEKRANPITPENPVPRRIYSVMPQYPLGATDERGSVTLRVTLDQSGRVAEVHSVRTPLQLALDRRGQAQIGIVGGFGIGPGRRGGQPPASRGAQPVVSPVMNDAFVTVAVDAVRQWQYEAPANGPISFDVTIGFRPDSEPQLLSHGASYMNPAGDFGAPPPPPPPPSTSWGSGAVRVGGTISVPVRVTNVPPIYPAIAKAAKVQGVVIIEAVIGPDGRVSDARVLRSIPLLDQAALDAVMQWEYTPTSLNGTPVPVIMTITVSFTTQ